MIEITEQPIDAAAMQSSVQSPQAGAIVTFTGTTREFTGERQTTRLEYDCYLEMARLEMSELERKARQRWPLIHCTIVHRIGVVEIGEASVVVCVSSAHRDAAFEAGRWIIDTLKETVPIWKKENWSDGSSEWFSRNQNHGSNPAPIPLSNFLSVRIRARIMARRIRVPCSPRTTASRHDQSSRAVASSPNRYSDSSSN